jgi:hypothetical protein
MGFNIIGDAIDGELRLPARAWRIARHISDCTLSTAHIDELLDERSELTGSCRLAARLSDAE